MLGYTAIALPFVLVTMIAVVQAYDERLDQAAAVCGAGTVLRLRRVTLPLLAPGALSAFLFAFVTSLDELTIALLSGGRVPPCPSRCGTKPVARVADAAAASTIIFLLMTLRRWRRPIRQRRSPQPRTSDLWRRLNAYPLHKTTIFGALR